jgi:uncharacterized membrane protein
MLIRLAFALALLFGLIHAALVPPFQVHDEQNHFYRAFQISEGQLVPTKTREGTGGMIPVSMSSEELGEAVRIGPIAFYPNGKFRGSIVLAERHRDLAPSVRAFMSFPHTAVYSPGNYLPQAGLPMRAARCPCVSVLVFAAALSGLGASKAESSSRHPWSPAWFTLMAGTLLLALCKPVYMCVLPVVLTSLYLKGRALTGRERLAFWSASALCLLVALGALAWWNFEALGIYTPYRTDVPIDPSAQMHYVLTHPFHFLRLAFLDFFTGIFGKDYLLFLVGASLGYHTNLSHHAMYAIALLTLVVALLEQPPCFPGRRAMAVAALLSFAGGVLLVGYGLYGSWTPVGADYIEGIHGRYYLPIIALLLWPACGLLHRASPRIAGLLPLKWAPAALTLVGAAIWLTYMSRLIYLRYY